MPNNSNKSMITLKALILLSFLSFLDWTHAQLNLDSLFNEKEKPLNDIERAERLAELGKEFVFKNLDSALLFSKEANDLLNNIPEQQKKDKKFQNLYSRVNSILGYIYGTQGNIFMATEVFYQSLEQSRKTGNVSSEVAALVNLTSVYQIQDDSTNAVLFGRKAIGAGARSEKPRDKASASFAYGSLLKDYELDSSKYYLLIAEENFVLSEDSIGLCRVVMTLGDIEKEQGELQKAIRTTKRALKIAVFAKDKASISNAYSALSELYLERKEAEIAKSYADSAYSMAKEVGAESLIIRSSLVSYKSQKELGNHELALQFHEEYVSTEKKYQEVQSNKDAIRLHYKVEYEKEAIADSLANEEERLIREAEKKEQELLNERKTQQLIYLGLILVLVVVFAFVLYRRLKVSNKQRRLIDQQKFQVETQHKELREKNREILDSINYAKRIQTAILPPIEMIKKSLPNSFILYEPKDIVAGDFYWMEQKRDKLIFAVADCTGHGVPGAMVSVICNNGLNRSVREHDLTDPAAILNKSRELIIEEFEKSAEDVNDGMDIALVTLNKTDSTTELRYAGANNPLWIIRAGSGSVEQIKADKQPIGVYHNPQPFNTHQTDLKSGDTFYIFSDGFADQFGGPKGKKFKSSQFKEFLLSIQSVSITKQKELLNDELKSWMGQHDQIDDICVWGVRIE